MVVGETSSIPCTKSCLEDDNNKQSYETAFLISNSPNQRGLRIMRELNYGINEDSPGFGK